MRARQFCKVMNQPVEKNHINQNLQQYTIVLPMNRGKLQTNYRCTTIFNLCQDRWWEEKYTINRSIFHF